MKTEDRAGCEHPGGAARQAPAPGTRRARAPSRGLCREITGALCVGRRQDRALADRGESLCKEGFPFLDTSSLCLRGLGKARQWVGLMGARPAISPSRRALAEGVGRVAPRKPGVAPRKEGDAAEPRPPRQRPRCRVKARVQQCGLEMRAQDSTVHSHPGLEGLLLSIRPSGLPRTNGAQAVS